MANFKQSDIDAIKSAMDINDSKQNKQIKGAFQKVLLDVESGGGLNYNVYTAILTQAGTGAPTATVLENTLSGTIVWSRTAAGDYRGTLAGEFDYNNTIIMGLTRNDIAAFFPANHIFTAGVLDANTIYLGTHTTSVSGVDVVKTAKDDLLLSIPIEIRVYS